MASRCSLKPHQLPEPIALRRTLSWRAASCCWRAAAPRFRRRSTWPRILTRCAALGSSDPVLAANKRLVFDMWRSIVDAGHTEAADEMLAEDYIQHSPVLRTGRKAFKEIFSVVPRREIPAAGGTAAGREHRGRQPGGDEPAGAGAGARRCARLRHDALQPVPGGQGPTRGALAFRPRRAGADVPLPEDGGPQPVVGAVGDAQLALLQSPDPQLARNKRLVFDLWRADRGCRSRGARARATCTQASSNTIPNAASGIEGFRRHFAARAARQIQPWITAPVVALVAEGDLVALVTMQEHPHPVRAGRTYTTTWFDMFRIADGRIAEHWDDAVPAELPGESAW